MGEYHKIVENLHGLLTEAQKERDKRPGLVEVPDVFNPADVELVPNWNLFELETMLTRVNQLRSLRGLPPVLMDRLRRVEQQACGHSDYTRKLALYAASLVIEFQKQPNEAT